jgi:surface carbohydrate biosynthesis protein
MRISRLVSKLKLFYKIFIASPKQWHLPKKAEVLIYDACEAEVMLPYLTKYSVTTMAVRGELINMSCLLLAMLKLDWWKGQPLRAYSNAFIQVVSPKVVITFIDNNPRFYEISKCFPNVKTIFVQNGLRSEQGDVFSSLVKSENYHVDHIMVFGVAIARKYKLYITGSVLALGSLKSNKVKKTNVALNGSILFFSQYRCKPKNNSPSHVDGKGEPLYHHQYYSSEAIVLRFLAKWCVEHKKSLKIAGMSQEKTSLEIDFFEAILGGCTWEYLPRTGRYNSYKLVDSADIVVGIDSTLSYESIGRGKKTAFFSCRGVNFLSICRNFGWPADLPNNGPFWTNDQDEMQFQRIMDYLNTVNDEDWHLMRQRYASELMAFDPGNTRLVGLLDQLLPKSDTQHVN